MKNFEIFDRIANGDLRPHKYESDGKLLEIKIQNLQITDEELAKYFRHLNKEGKRYSIKITEVESGDIILNEMRNDEFNELIDLAIPPPPDYKGELYLDLIEFEFDRNLISFKEYFNDNTEKSLKKYATKNIQISKLLYKDNKHYKKLIIKEGKLDWRKSNDFVIYILQVFLERIIHHLLEIFSPYIHSAFRSKIIELLSQETTEVMIKMLEFEFNNLAKKYKEKTGFNLPWSVPLFELEREEISKLPTFEEKLNRYKDYSRYWRSALLSDPLLEVGNEISGRIIPLIENEIDNLWSPIHSVTDRKNYDLSIVEETESVDDDINDKPRINFKKEVTEFVNRMIETKILDINDKYFVRDAKKKFIAELDVEISAANRESIRTYLSKIKGAYNREIKRGKRKKK